MDGETLQQKTAHKGGVNSKLQDLQRQEGVGELVWNIRLLLGTMEQMPKAIKDIVFTCVVLHNMLRTHQG